MTVRRLQTEVGITEFIGWIAFFRREQREQRLAHERANDKAKAEKMARAMAGMR